MKTASCNFRMGIQCFVQHTDSVGGMTCSTRKNISSLNIGSVDSSRIFQENVRNITDYHRRRSHHDGLREHFVLGLLVQFHASKNRVILSRCNGDGFETVFVRSFGPLNRRRKPMTDEVGHASPTEFPQVAETVDVPKPNRPLG